MKTRILCLSIALATGVAGFASESPSDSEEGAAPLDWESLKDLDNVKAGVIAEGGSGTREEMTAAYLARADDLRAIRSRGDDGVEPGEAKRLEALALLYAGWGGDTSRDADRDQLVAEVRADESIPAGQRSVVAAYAENLEVRRQEFESRADRLLAFEEKARGLIAEFPGVPDNYEALLQLARSQTDAEGQRTVADLLEMPAPEWIKAEAEALQERYALVGQNLADLAGTETGAALDVVLSSGTPVVVYTWTATNAATFRVAERIRDAAADRAEVIGVNLDDDPVAAATVAGKQGLPGVQLFLANDDGAAFADRLRLTIAPLVYVTDAAGAIRTVSAHNSIVQAIKSASAE